MERRWLSLARNYEFAERLSRFTTETHVDEVLRLDRLALIAAQHIRPFHRDAGRDRAAIVGDQRALDATLHAAVPSRRIGWAAQ